MPQPPARAGGTLPALTDVLTSAAASLSGQAIADIIKRHAAAAGQ
jgi:hypothetical protein